MNISCRQRAGTSRQFMPGKTSHAQNLTLKFWQFQKTKSDGKFVQLSFCTERSHSARYTSGRGLEAGRHESSMSSTAQFSRFRLRLQEPSVWRRGLPSGKNFKRQKMPATSSETRDELSRTVFGILVEISPTVQNDSRRMHKICISILYSRSL